MPSTNEVDIVPLLHPRRICCYWTAFVQSPFESNLA